MKSAQEGLEIFYGAAEATGGHISEDKTKWYLMDYNPQGNGTYMTMKPRYH